jgi:glycosyltransferase involved in cell wall biosynthesis
MNLVYLVEDSGGSGRYARQLIAAMLERETDLELHAWVGSTAPADLLREPWAQEVRWRRLSVPGVGSPWHLWYELAGIGIAARRERLDVLHGLANLVALAAPAVARVVTILDVIWMHHPDAMGARARIAMRTLAPLCGRAASRVIAISEAAAEDVSATLGIPREKFDVTPLGMTPPRAGLPVSAEADMRKRLGLREGPLLLCVAAKRAHKNLDGLIRALAALPLAPGAHRPLLVLPGSPTDYERTLRGLATELGLGADVAFPGWVSEPDLEALYAAASAFVLPSFQEGFGLPVLEAMVRGVPVACSNTSSLPEVAGEAALLFDPSNPASIAAALERVLGDPALAAELSRRGRERARQFTWARTAELTLASYRRALGPDC